MSQKTAVLFVHGLFSGPKIWAPLLASLQADKRLASRFDWAPYRYRSPLLEWNPLRRVPDLDTIATGLMTYFDEQLRPYSRIAIITHSQGGLAIQRYLAKMIADGRGLDLMRIRRITMFSCPNNGSEFALSLRKAVWIWRHAQERQLRPLSPDIEAARVRVLNCIVHVTSAAPDRCPIPIAAYAGESDNIVTPGSAIAEFPMHGVLPGDHFTIIEPQGDKSLLVTTVTAGLIQSLKELKPRVSDWRAKAEQDLLMTQDVVHERRTFQPIDIPIVGTPVPLRVVVEAGGMDQLANIDIVVSSENVYFEMAKPFKPSTSGRLRSGAAVKNAVGEIIDDVMFNELNSWLRSHGRHGLRVAPGTVAPTGPGELVKRGIRRVYHAAIVVPKPGTNEYDVPSDAIPLAVKNVFALARSERQTRGNLRTIAIPLFGAGRGGMNPDESFATIWTNLCQEHAIDPSWEVHLCTWKVHETQIVLERLQQLADGTAALNPEVGGA